MKSMAREQLQSRKDKAARFVRDVLGDSERADEIEDEDLEDYAELRRIQLTNSERTSMANVADSRTKADLLDEIDQLEQENADLQDQLDAIADIVVPPADEDDEQNGDIYDDDSD
jgi:hypothetical protein